MLSQQVQQEIYETTDKYQQYFYYQNGMPTKEFEEMIIKTENAFVVTPTVAKASFAEAVRYEELTNKLRMGDAKIA